MMRFFSIFVSIVFFCFKFRKSGQRLGRNEYQNHGITHGFIPPVGIFYINFCSINFVVQKQPVSFQREWAFKMCAMAVTFHILVLILTKFDGKEVNPFSNCFLFP